MADNLRYWIKSAELRWDITLDVPVSDVVNDKDETSWNKFDDAVFKWSQGVRKELMEEWMLEKRREERRRPPELKFEPSEDVANVEVEQEAKTEVLEITAKVIDVHADDRPVADVTAELAVKLGEPEAQPTPEIAGDLQPITEVAAEAEAKNHEPESEAAPETASSLPPVADVVTELEAKADVPELQSAVEDGDTVPVAVVHEVQVEDKPEVPTTQVEGGSQQMSTEESGGDLPTAAAV